MTWDGRGWDPDYTGPMKDYRSMQPCVECGRKPTKALEHWKREGDGPLRHVATNHFCVLHDPYNRKAVVPEDTKASSHKVRPEAKG